MNAKIHLYTLAVAAMGFFAAPANASTLSTISANGAVYSGTYSTLATNDYQFTLNIDLSGYTGGGSYLNSLSFKVGSNTPTFSLISAPDAVTNWNTQSGKLNASGCSGSSAGAVCITDTANAYGLNISSYVGHSTPLQFVFDMGNNALTTQSGLAVMTLYEDTQGKKVGSLLSLDMLPTGTTTTVSTVPLPAAAWLFGSALVGFTMVSSRKKV